MAAKRLLKIAKLSLFTVVILLLSFTCKRRENMVEVSLRAASNAVIVELPYTIKDRDMVFQDDSPLAIDVLEIKADGKVLNFIDNVHSFSGRTYWKLKPVLNDQKAYYASMYWIKVGSKKDFVFRWNDGRGIYSTEIEPGIYQPHINSYEIEKNMKTLEITYRIRLPHKEMPEEGAYRYSHDIPNISLYSQGEFIISQSDLEFSDIYHTKIDVKDLWECFEKQ